MNTETNEPPLAQDWKIDAILETLIRDCPQATEAQPARLGIVFFLDRYGFPSFALESARRRHPVHFSQMAQPTTDMAASFDYVLEKTGHQGLEVLTPQADAINAFIRGRADLFRPLGRYDLPDGSTATLYRVTKSR